MNVSRTRAILLFVAVGCDPGDDDHNESAVKTTPAPTAAEAQVMPVRITNQFGMTFCLVEIDTSRPDHQGSFPQASDNLQEIELTGEQNAAFRKAAFGDGTFETINWYHNSGFPSEWREVFRYGQALSKFDAE